LASDAEADHLPILVRTPAEAIGSVLVHAFKGRSSRTLLRNRPDIASRCCDDVLWTRVYVAASAGSAALAIIKQHVEQQSQRASSSPKGEASVR
jgi:REP element-mobilizing transposase RayT